MPPTPDLVAFLREHRDECKVVLRECGRLDLEFDSGEVLVDVDLAVLRQALDDVEQLERINQ